MDEHDILRCLPACQSHGEALIYSYMKIDARLHSSTDFGYRIDAEGGAKYHPRGRDSQTGPEDYQDAVLRRLISRVSEPNSGLEMERARGPNASFWARCTIAHFQVLDGTGIELERLCRCLREGRSPKLLLTERWIGWRFMSRHGVKVFVGLGGLSPQMEPGILQVRVPNGVGNKYALSHFESRIEVRLQWRVIGTPAHDPRGRTLVDC